MDQKKQNSKKALQSNPHKCLWIHFEWITFAWNYHWWSNKSKIRWKFNQEDNFGSILTALPGRESESNHQRVQKAHNKGFRDLLWEIICVLQFKEGSKMICEWQLYNSLYIEKSKLILVIQWRICFLFCWKLWS